MSWTCLILIRIILFILNVLLLLVSIVMITFGTLATTLAGKLLALAGQLGHSAKTKELFQIPDLPEVEKLPLGPVGVGLLCIGVVLLLIAFMGVMTASYPFKILMILFVTLISLSALISIIFGMFVMCKDSFLHDKVKNLVAQQLKDNYINDVNDPFSAAFNALQVVLQCCGIHGKTVFDNGVPGSCCSRNIIDGSNMTMKMLCVNQTITPDDYNDKGCYRRLQEMVLGSPLVISGYALFVIIQVSEVTLGSVYLVLPDVSISPI